MNGKGQAFVNGRLDHLEALFFFCHPFPFFLCYYLHFVFRLHGDDSQLLSVLRASLPSGPKYLFLVRSLPHFSLAI